MVTFKSPWTSLSSPKPSASWASTGLALTSRRRMRSGRRNRPGDHAEMAQELRVLIVEDNERDAALLLRELKRGGYDLKFERVDTPEAMAAAIDDQRWDLVISDFSM